MENIVNVQVRASQQVQALPVRQAEPKDDFMKLLNQQKEITDQTAQAQKTDQPKDTAAADETVSKPSDEQPKAPKDAQDAAEEDMQQLAVEQAAAQLAGMVAEVQEQILPEVTMTGVDTPSETTAQTELISQTDAGEIALEAVQPQTKEPAAVTSKAAQTVQEPKQPLSQEPEQPLPQETLPEQPVEAVQEQTAPAEDHSAREEHNDIVPVQTQTDKTDSEPVSKTVEEESSRHVYAAQNTDGPHIQTVHMSAAETDSQSTVVTSTIEELPQQLSNAFLSGQAQERQTLTIELEPASLGKLTIRLEYEAGRAAVSIIASNPRTLELLNAKASEIASILKERTGEEIEIYTQEPQQELAEQYDGSQGNGRGRQEERQPKEHRSEQQAESFAQQLRLGLL